jgi:NADP-dependent 3-hydroxy acid dehydrogenase YdfG
VLVTGSGRGIGKVRMSPEPLACLSGSSLYDQAIATAFAVAGASTIILTARSQHELESTRQEILSDLHLDPPPRILAWATDVSSNDSVEALFAMLDREGVVIDTLITNAGVCT